MAVFEGGEGDDLFVGGSANDTATGNGGNDTLDGGGGNDTLDGGEGDDILIGRAGDDVLRGGAGTDTASYVGATSAVTVRLDLIIAQNTGGAGIDTLSDIENLIGSSHADVLTGDAGANRLEGGAGDDVLDGGAGVDILVGGAGWDTYYVDKAGDQIIETWVGGIDTVYATSNYRLPTGVDNGVVAATGNRTLTGNIGSNVLTGNVGNDTLVGGEGGDFLRGGAGVDTLIGGLHDDWYVVDRSDDVVIELDGEGVDSVQASSDFVLPFAVENGYVSTDQGSTLTGNVLDNRLEGQLGGDTLIGGGGNDVLDGRWGADAMLGGVGDDRYYVDNVGDVVVELAGEGVDTVTVTIDYVLGANVENGIVVNGVNARLTGNDLDNDLSAGWDGRQIFDGGAGIDRMTGGWNDDIYYVDRAGDIVVELWDGGIDTVFASSNYTLAANVEIGIVNATGNRTMTGNGLANRLTGNVGNDTLNGGGGGDTLTGGAGADRFKFSSVADTAWNTYDWIKDLEAADIIDLSAIDANTTLAGDQAFVKVSSFTGVAGQVRLIYSSASGDTWVQGDVNGDGVGDFRIRMPGDHRAWDNFAL